jgi:hypothetical protein
MARRRRPPWPLVRRRTGLRGRCRRMRDRRLPADPCLRVLHIFSSPGPSGPATDVRDALRRLDERKPSFRVICRDVPLSTCLRASTPATIGHPTAASVPDASLGTSETRSALVVLHHLDGFLRAQPRIESGACSMNEGASVLQPAADWGSSRFRAGRLDRRTLPSCDRGRPSLPRDAHTPRRSLAGSRIVSPRPLPPCWFHRPPDRGWARIRLRRPPRIRTS